MLFFFQTNRASPGRYPLQAAGLALRDWPFVNASMAADQSAVICHRHVNIGVAIATPHGLVVPNIKDVQVG